MAQRAVKTTCKVSLLLWALNNSPKYQCHQSHMIDTWSPTHFYCLFGGGGGGAVKILSKSGSEKHFLELNLWIRFSGVGCVLSFIVSLVSFNELWCSSSNVKAKNRVSVWLQASNCIQRNIISFQDLLHNEAWYCRLVLIIISTHTVDYLCVSV